MPPRRATRASGPAATQAPVEDDTPTRAELIEALGNLRVESDRAFSELQRATSRASSARWMARWTSLHRHMDNLCEGVDTLDATPLISAQPGPHHEL